MTEDEAKTKWCPFVRGKCIASECMAWRGEPIMTTNDDGKIVCRTDGYCGLAGKP